MAWLWLDAVLVLRFTAYQSAVPLEAWIAPVLLLASCAPPSRPRLALALGLEL